jgi:hypothetical protein
MHNHVAEIHDEPALARLAFDAPFFLVILFGCLENAFCQCVEHTVTGAVANNEIIGKGCDIFDVKKQDVFALFVLQGVDDFMCKIESVQVSPHDR